MTLIDSGTGFLTDEDTVLGRIVGLGAVTKPTSVETYPLVENELVQAVWDGSDLHVYSDRLATSVIGELFLRPGRTISMPYIGFFTDESATASTEVTIAAIHDLSGLTWEQIARALAVSKRTVLLWARGGRVSNKNYELVVSLKQLVDSMPGDPDTRRNTLLSSTPTHAGALTRWVQENVGGQARINAPIHAAHELMG